MTDLILEAFKNVLDRDFAEQPLVRDEIRQRGQIWKLRRQVESLRKQISDREQSRV